MPSSSKSMRQQVEEYVFALQDQIVTAFESLDPASPLFKRDSWIRPEGGKGTSCVFAIPSSSSATSSVLEKAGVNISIVHGTLPPKAIAQMRVEHASIPYDPSNQKGLPFFAAGLSLVIHPRNPHAPTVHANYRYFEITEPAPEGSTEPGKLIAWWFGGGSDLTPSYLYEEDARHFHAVLKAGCDKHGAGLYPSFKQWCDEYFYLPHRGETRGIGGIFFDDLTDEQHKRLQPQDGATPRKPEEIFAFIQTMGNTFVESYVPILQRRMNTPSTEEQRRWQLLRRGRYVEFNLVYDRGTKFGLATPGARIESILMSLPETARWEYMSEMGTVEGTEEARLLEVLKKPRNWV